MVAAASTNSPLSSLQIDAASHLLSILLEPQLNRLELPGADGWMAVFSRSNGACLAQHFTVVKGGRYPDRLPAAIWFNGPGELSLHGKFFHNPDPPETTPAFLETQIFSPMVDLRPGQDFRFEIDWHLTRCPTPVAQFTPAGILHQPLRLTHRGTLAELEINNQTTDRN